MEQQFEGVARNDLFLRFTRQKSVQWEALPSPAKFFKPLVHHKFQYGNIYVQGVLVDPFGNALSEQALVDLVVQHGDKAVEHIEGDFVMAVDDSRYGVWCATDPSATLPLYYKLTSNELLISSRAENLSVRSANDLSLPGIIAALSSGYPWGELTLLKDWKALRPGHVVKIDTSNNASVSCYFDPETDESIEGFRNAQELIDAVDKGLKSIASRYKRLLIPLSGGVDSRLIAVRCYALGIPFEAITFVANVPDGDDFDVASRLVKVFGVKHHRWEWNPSVENCIEKFAKLCIASGGGNDAYTSYPDGMSIFGKVASGFDCALRGDHVFGYGEFAESVYRSAIALSINYWDNMDWVLNPAYQSKVNMESVFEEQEGIRIDAPGPEANAWRHISYRKSRSPRFLLPVGQLQSQYALMAYPFLTKEIVARLSRTEPGLRDGKLIAKQALEVCSPPEISRIPLSNQPTWKNTEPLLNLPSEVTSEMIKIVRQPNVLSEIVDDSAVINAYSGFLSGQSHGKGHRSLLSSLKEIVKKTLPKSMIAAYQDATQHGFKTPPQFVFKRYFAMKVFLNSISENVK